MGVELRSSSGKGKASRLSDVHAGALPALYDN